MVGRHRARLVREREAAPDLFRRAEAAWGSGIDTVEGVKYGGLARLVIQREAR
jgi:hypothetical protein